MARMRFMLPFCFSAGTAVLVVAVSETAVSVVSVDAVVAIAVVVPVVIVVEGLPEVVGEGVTLVVAGGSDVAAIGGVTIAVVGTGSGDRPVLVDAAGGFAGATVDVLAIFVAACSSCFGLGTGVDSMRGVAAFGDEAFAVLADGCLAVCAFGAASAVFRSGFGLVCFFGGAAAAGVTGGPSACRARSVCFIADSRGDTETPSLARWRADS